MSGFWAGFNAAWGLIGTPWVIGFAVGLCSIWLVGRWSSRAGTSAYA